MSISGFHRASLLSVTFINQLMHSILTIVDVKICITQKFKRHTLKYTNMFPITNDPSSGSDELYLIEIPYNVSIVLIMCVVGVWRHVNCYHYYYYYYYYIYFTFVSFEVFSSLDVTGIKGLPRNFGISSSFSITRISCGSANFVSAAIFICQMSTSLWNRFFASLLHSVMNWLC